jgi:hypothetical protein
MPHSAFDPNGVVERHGDGPFNQRTPRLTHEFGPDLRERSRRPAAKAADEARS